jgi:hypothetical protein
VQHRFLGRAAQVAPARALGGTRQRNGLHGASLCETRVAQAGGRRVMPRMSYPRSEAARAGSNSGARLLAAEEREAFTEGLQLFQ